MTSTERKERTMSELSTQAINEVLPHFLALVWADAGGEAAWSQVTRMASAAQIQRLLTKPGLPYMSQMALRTAVPGNGDVQALSDGIAQGLLRMRDASVRDFAHHAGQVIERGGQISSDEDGLNDEWPAIARQFLSKTR
jgi:hypothetical protein